jgi:hypothetical protein
MKHAAAVHFRFSRPLTLLGLMLRAGTRAGVNVLAPAEMNWRIIMNRNTTLRLLVAALVATFVLSMGPLAQAASGKCSLSKLAGTYGLTTTGSIPGIGPVAAVGLMTLDASGNISGSQTRSLNGDIADETFTGTATVNSDCTGTDTVSVFESGVLVRTSTLKLVFDDAGRSARAIFTSIVLPDVPTLASILTVDARRMRQGD